MRPERISILVHDISSNIVGAATALARGLSTEYAVEVVGPDLGGGVCSMYRDALPYRVVSAPRLYRLPDFWWERRKLERAVTGDVIVAVKAYADTVPVALRLKSRSGRKVLVYLDEWDAADYEGLSRVEKIRQWVLNAHHPLDDHCFPLIERLIPQADGVICTSRFLAERFGGTVVPIGVDVEAYAPRAPDETAELKRSLGMADDRLIVFGGVVRPHKGVEEILEALAFLGDESILLVVVGPQTEFLRSLQRSERFAPYIACIDAQPKEEMPRYLALADLVVLPQKDTPLAQSQVPCKVFEAMAMEKPIIATAVSDLPEILSGCGWTVPPGDLRELAGAIQHALSHPDEGATLGTRAREKCIREYSQSVTSAKLVELVSHLFHSKPSTINH
ncbi:MAG: glycosyltransferase family 4 protein [Kiritimatiellae bacterium]|nr:glycosyltransferase family 4 protein [Kiritimatiellia bacterium]